MDKDTVLELIEFLDSKKAENVMAIELTGITSIADYFVLASAPVQTQIDSLREMSEEFMRKKGHKPGNSATARQTGWVLLDYNDCVIHLFVSELREFYNLERIWGQGSVIRPV